MSGLLRFRGDRWHPVDQGRESPYGHAEGKIGNAYEMHSIVQSGLIPGGKSLIRDRQSVFFTAVNPMYAPQDLEGVEQNLDKPRIAP